MQLTIVTATGRRGQLEVQPEQLTAAALQAAVKQCLGLPQDSGLRLVSGGQPLADDEAVSRMRDGDTVLAAVAPKPPPKAVRQLAAGSVGDDDEEDTALLRLQLPPDTPLWQRAALHFLRTRLRVPEAMLAVAVRAGWRFWVGLLLWMAGARLAASYELGPPYIILTIFALILLNLGQRREGEWSAYSLFNPGLRRLPGQMTAEDLDRQVRRGAM